VHRLVNTASDTSRRYMRALRVNPDSEEDLASLFDPEYEHLELWYALAMADHLEDSPALSSHGTLMMVLRESGWPEWDIWQMIGGESLPSLIEACRIRWFITNFRRASYGGWLPLTQAERLLDRLLPVEASFRDPPRSVLSWYQVNRPEWTLEHARSVVFAQYHEAVAMLQAAIGRGRPLRLCVDE
jgi:hypothetical protein